MADVAMTRKCAGALISLTNPVSYPGTPLLLPRSASPEAHRRLELIGEQNLYEKEALNNRKEYRAARALVEGLERIVIEAVKRRGGMFRSTFRQATEYVFENRDGVLVISEFDWWSGRSKEIIEIGERARLLCKAADEMHLQAEEKLKNAV